MVMPLDITFHGMDGTDTLRADIRRHADKLEQFAQGIIKCSVVMEPAEHHHHKGNRFVVRIRLTLPGGELDVGHAPSGDQSHQDAYVAIRDAFGAMRRKLQDFHRRQQGQVKHHELSPHGRVRYVDTEAGHGVIETPEGREIRFERNSLVDADFDKLQAGDEVRFTEVAGEEGPRASTVHLLTRHYGG